MNCALLNCHFMNFRFVDFFNVPWHVKSSAPVSVSRNERKNKKTGMFYGLSQFKNAIFRELQKLKSRNGLCQNDSMGCGSLCSEYERTVESSQTLQSHVFPTAECEICTDPLTAKAVYSCNTCFNLMCSLCMLKVRRCPFCRTQGMFADRNIPLERFLATLNLPCKNQRYGCKECLDKNTRDVHERKCEFSPFYCPHHPNCHWSGNAEQLKDHLRENHLTRLIQSNHTQVKIRCLWSKMKATYDRKKTSCLILYCNSEVFVCKVSLYRNNIIISFAQLKTHDRKLDDKHRFGVGIQVSSSYRMIRGILPLHTAVVVQKISLTPKFILSPDDLENDSIVIAIDILDLDSVLSE